ncbi:MAG: hypothetical protein V1770_00945 [bacterium]
MIKILLINGQEIQISGNQLLNKFGSLEEGSNISPGNLFTTLIFAKQGWRIDFSEATEIEKSLWRTPNIQYKIFSAWQAGKQVKILGKIFRPSVKDGEVDIALTLAEIADSLPESDNLKIIDSEENLTIDLVN